MLRFCGCFVLMTSAGMAGYLIASAIFGYMAMSVPRIENDAMSRAFVEGMLGVSFSALTAFISAYFVFRKLNFRNPVKRSGN